LRRGFGAGIVTALARVDGRALGVVANQPPHLGGAIDADGADKAARFMALCDAFELPLLFLCDTPGFMVGPEAEKTATVRHFARMFLLGANLTVPTGTIVLRKGYGLGAQAMAAGGFKAPLFTVGQVAEMLAVKQAFLRRVDELRVVSPQRSAGGQRRYTRYEIRVIQQVVSMADEGITLQAVRRIIELEQQLAEVTRERDELARRLAEYR